MVQKNHVLKLHKTQGCEIDRLKKKSCFLFLFLTLIYIGSIPEATVLDLQRRVTANRSFAEGVPWPPLLKRGGRVYIQGILNVFIFFRMMCIEHSSLDQHANVMPFLNYVQI